MTPKCFTDAIEDEYSNEKSPFQIILELKEKVKGLESVLKGLQSRNEDIRETYKNRIEWLIKDLGFVAKWFEDNNPEAMMPLGPEYVEMTVLKYLNTLVK